MSTVTHSRAPYPIWRSVRIRQTHCSQKASAPKLRSTQSETPSSASTIKGKIPTHSRRKGSSGESLLPRIIYGPEYFAARELGACRQDLRGRVLQDLCATAIAGRPAAFSPTGADPASPWSVDARRHSWIRQRGIFRCALFSASTN